MKSSESDSPGGHSDGSSQTAVKDRSDGTSARAAPGLPKGSIFVAVDSYTDKPQRIVGPFDTRTAAWDWCDGHTPIGQWGVDEVQTPKAFEEGL